jgi:hypothetical protein
VILVESGVGDDLGCAEQPRQVACRVADAEVLPAEEAGDLAARGEEAVRAERVVDDAGGELPEAARRASLDPRTGSPASATKLVGRPWTAAMADPIDWARPESMRPRATFSP